MIVFSAIGPMALNIFFPSMPSMMKVFDTDYGTVQFALTLYLTALAMAQLFVGPISDRVGRRPVVLWGMGICMAGSLTCIFAPTIGVLIMGRILQALGASTGMVMARSMIRDMHGLDKAASMIGYVTMVMVVAPMVSPTLGALLEKAFDWRAGFVLVLFVTAGVLAVSVSILGETHKGPYEAAGIGRMLGAFVTLLKQRRFNRHAFQISLSSAAFFTFLGGAPYVSIQLLGMSGVEYGLYFMVASLSYMAGNFTTGRMSERWGSDRLITLGTSVGLLGGLMLALAYVSDHFTPVSLFGCMGMIALGNGLCLPSGTASAISADKNHIGAAAGLSGFLQMATGALASYTVGIMLSDSAFPLVAMMASSVALAFIVNLISLNHRA